MSIKEKLALMSRKKIILSSSLIVAVVALAIGATYSYFSDTETSTGNKFVAGKFNLQIDNTCHYNGKVCTGGVWEGTTEPCLCTWAAKDLTNELFFDFPDVKPGDTGEDTISLHIDDNDAWICAELLNIKNFENGCDSPENKVDDVATSCGDPGEGQGELQNNLFFTVWKDTDCDNVLDDGVVAAHCANVGATTGCERMNDNEQLCKLMPPTDCTWVPATPGEQVLVDNQSAENLLWPIADSQHGPAIPGDTDYCVGVAWNVPIETSNIIQTDSLEGDVKFTAVQARNMDTFKCADLTQVACVPATEVCNGLDDDCDQVIDEDDPQLGAACDGADADSCQEGTLMCSGGGTICSDNTNDNVEICNGLDDDCDGQTTDEASACGVAELSCTDGLDNDSDQAIDCQDPGCFYNSLDCVAPVCGDGTCRSPLETYANCPSDCASLAPAPECTSDAQCNDNKFCTADTCVNGSCVRTPNNNMCFNTNSCLLATCVGAIPGADVWGCTYQASANIGSSCSDALGCGLSGGCNGYTCNASGACAAPVGTPPVGCANCDDGNSCTNDSCVGNTCQHTNIVLGQCIFGGSCTNGTVTCNPNPNCPNNCDDGDACTTDACEIYGCTHTATPNTLDCGNSAGEYCDQSTGQHFCDCYLAPLNYPNCSITIPNWPF